MINANFQSAPVVLPCVNPVPEGRPTIEKLTTMLDGLVRKIVGSVNSALSLEEQKLLEEGNIIRIKYLFISCKCQTCTRASIIPNGGYTSLSVSIFTKKICP